MNRKGRKGIYLIRGGKAGEKVRNKFIIIKIIGGLTGYGYVV